MLGVLGWGGALGSAPNGSADFSDTAAAADPSKSKHTKRPSRKAGSIWIDAPQNKNGFFRSTGSKIKFLFGVSGGASAGRQVVVWAGCHRCKTKVRVNRHGRWTALLPMNLSSPYSPSRIHVFYVAQHNKGDSIWVRWIKTRKPKTHKKKRSSSHRHQSNKKQSTHPKHRKRPNKSSDNPVPDQNKGQINSARAALSSILQEIINGQYADYCYRIDSVSLQECLGGDFKPAWSPTEALAGLSGSKGQIVSEGIVFVVSGSRFVLLNRDGSWRLAL